VFAATTELHLWQARLDSDEWRSAERLPDEDRDRAARLEGTARRRWVAGCWALRGVLGRYLAEEPAEIELRVGDRGKPMLVDPRSSLRFNLSHSRDLALVAVARGREVGVDVEWIDPRRDVLALARRALGPAEARGVEEAPPQARPAAFHAAWTRHEAIAKCHGTGLRGPLPDSAVAVSDLDAGPGFAGAIAVAGDAVPPLRRFVIEPGLVSAPTG
jgi:4'-phosphopantetheinyl transferase